MSAAPIVLGPGEAVRIACEGVTLQVARAGEGPPVVVLHGFTGSAESMAGVAEALAADHAVYSVDLVGHGASDAPDDVAHYTMPRCVAQLRALAAALGLRRPHWLGYSMGARVALSLCAAAPDEAASALLVGVSPGLAEASARDARIASDRALARRIVDDGLEAFVDGWMALPLFASQRRLGTDALARARAQRLRNRPHGLARSLEGMGTGEMPPLHDALPGLRTPVLLVVGDEDAKFRAIAVELAARLPDARVEVLGLAGHAAHLEQPAAFARVARRFFAQVEGGAPARPARVASPAGPDGREERA